MNSSAMCIPNVTVDLKMNMMNVIKALCASLSHQKWKGLKKNMLM